MHDHTQMADQAKTWAAVSDDDIIQVIKDNDIIDHKRRCVKSRKAKAFDEFWCEILKKLGKKKQKNFER